MPRPTFSLRRLFFILAILSVPLALASYCRRQIGAFDAAVAPFRPFSVGPIVGTGDDMGVIFGGVHALTTLDLRDSELDDVSLFALQESLEGLPNLQTLNLSGTKITDVGLTALKHLRSLRDLGLHRTHVSDEGVNGLRKSIPHCKIYY
jgi:Leucine-rich repeat (LRR) protein